MLAFAQLASAPPPTVSVEMLSAIAESDREDLLRRIGAVRQLEQRERARQSSPAFRSGRDTGQKASDSPTLAALKRLTENRTEVVAKSAVAAIARLGDPEEVVAVLQTALARGIFPPEDVARELAINVPGMPDALLMQQVAQVLQIAGPRGDTGDRLAAQLLQSLSTRCAHLPITGPTREAAQRAIDWSKARRRSWASVQRNDQLMLVQNTHLLEARLKAGKEDARMTDALYRVATESKDAIDLLAVLVSAFGEEVGSRIAAQGHLEGARIRLSALRGLNEPGLEMDIAEAEARLQKSSESSPRNSRPR
jgi:hypothetical protein